MRTVSVADIGSMEAAQQMLGALLKENLASARNPPRYIAVNLCLHD